MVQGGNGYGKEMPEMWSTIRGRGYVLYGLWGFRKRCPNCGAVLDPKENFCSECGTKVSLDPSISAPQTSPKGYKKWMPLGIAAAVVLVIGIVLSASSDSFSDTSTSSGGSISVKADDMINDYVRDQSSAEKQYKDKQVKVTGQLITKSQFSNSQNYGLLIGNKNMAGKNYLILVDLPSEKAAEANKVKVGDFVAAEGKCVGIVKQDDPTKISVQIQTDKIN